jgi:hypothetical protein
MEKYLQFTLESHFCAEGLGETEVMCGWEVRRPEAGKEVRKLSHIYCHRPRGCWLGSDDCSWECWEAIEKKG